MASSATIAPTIFREYIDVSKSYPENFYDFLDIINPNINEFDFIIAFVTEKYDENGRGTGTFQFPSIDDMFRRLKEKCEPNCVKVKVVISIGGRGSKYPFNPAAPETWPDNASASLMQIINDLPGLIHGIDIKYDTITSGGGVDVFTGCMGRLITILKKENPLVISIAPSFSVDAHYAALYRANGNNIDWVDYQFYTDRPPFVSVDEFVKRYRWLAKEEYPGHKLLAGFSTDPYDAGHLSREDFLDGCEVLKNAGELPGIFIWNANDSYFPMEREAQNLLTQN